MWDHTPLLVIAGPHAAPGYLYGQPTLVWEKGNDAELAKAITSALHKSSPIILWDSIAEGTMVASAVLAQLLTSPEWSARMLGSSGAGFTAVNDRMWMATGNNIRLGGDMSTRTLLVRRERRVGGVPGPLAPSPGLHVPR